MSKKVIRKDKKPRATSFVKKAQQMTDVLSSELQPINIGLYKGSKKLHQMPQSPRDAYSKVKV